jgi:hypothetical protein
VRAQSLTEAAVGVETSHQSQDLVERLGGIIEMGQR